MINISSAARQAMQSDAVQYIKIKVEPLTGDTFTITDADITQGGMKIETHTLDGEELEIGNMNAAVLDLTLDNESGKFNGVRFAGARLTVFVGVDVNETVEHMPLGVFTVDEQPHLWGTVSLAAYDNMVQMDIPYKPSTVFPNSLRNLVRECVEQSGLICYDYSMFPDEYIITVPPSGDSLTYRQVAMWCCQCACVNGCADENGNVKFAFYRKYTPEAVQAENGESLELENGDILLANGVGDVHYHLKSSERFISNMMIEEEDVMITGHRFTDDEDNIYPTDVNTEYCIETTGNGVFNAMTVEGKIATAAAVDEAIRGFTYRAFTAEIVSLPFLQTGDSIAYHDENGLYQTFITNWEYNPNGKMSISAKAKSLREKGYAPLGSLTPGQKAIIEQVNKNVEKTRAELTDRETALLLFNEQMFNSMGLYKTVKDSENGGVIIYYHDKTELETSGTIYMFGASGFAWTTDGWNDGEPLWNYGFTGAGDAILNTIHAYMISADLIKTGLLQSRNGASWINMDDGTFCFRAVKDAYMDLDTGEMKYTYTKVLELANKVLNIYGVLRNLNYPNFSLSVGPSETGGGGAITVTDNREGYGDIFQTYVVSTDSKKGTVWTSPFLINSAKTNRKGIAVFPSEITMFNDNYGKQTHFMCSEGIADMAGADAWMRLYKDNINVSTSASHRHFWFNYYPVARGNNPVAYDFGNGQGGHADVVCANIECGAVTSSGEVKCTSVNSSGYGIFSYKIAVGGDTMHANAALTVNGMSSLVGNVGVWGSCTANEFINSSDPNLKMNITPVSKLNALRKISKMNFYSYDYTGENAIHVNIGTMAPEAPSEIQSEDGKGIDLYAYISLTAKAVQELSAKVEQQEKKIAELEAEIDALKQ